MKRIVMLATLAAITSGTVHAAVTDGLTPSQAAKVTNDAIEDCMEIGQRKTCQCVVHYLNDHTTLRQLKAYVDYLDRVGTPSPAHAELVIQASVFCMKQLIPTSKHAPRS